MIQRDGDSFGRDDLLRLARAAEKAFDHINRQLQAEEEQPDQPGCRLPQPHQFTNVFPASQGDGKRLL